jgi:hypothetical protein
VTYFSSEAMWTYLTIPFLYTYPGFAVEELALWHEEGEEWRPLKATFPDSFRVIRASKFHISERMAC